MIKQILWKFQWIYLNNMMSTIQTNWNGLFERYKHDSSVHIIGGISRKGPTILIMVVFID